MTGARWTAGLLVGALACSEPASTPDDTDRVGAAEPWFRESAAERGLVFEHRTGHTDAFWMPEIAMGGVGLLDYDGDGDLDVYCVQGGSLDPSVAEPPGNQLLRNSGDGHFEPVTASAGVGDRGYGMGCAAADYDGDGDLDLYVTNVGPNVLYRNDGDGTFTDVTADAGVGDAGWGTSCAFFDYDGDGRLDLFVVNCIRWAPEREIACQSRGGLPTYCSPLNYQAPARDTLYHNVGNGRFEEVTARAGVDQAYGNGLGIACADFDGDGRLDAYVANDGTPNQLWMNLGDGRFRDEAMIRGCAVNAHGVAEAGMGVTAVDLGEDGLLDLFLSHLTRESNTLYLNRGDYFDDATSVQGLGAPSQPFTGFGLGFVDFDHDGHLDLYVANGRVTYGQNVLDAEDPFAEPNQLFHGLADGRFEEVLPRGGTTEPRIATSRAAAFGDLDGDGDVDVVVANRDGPLHFFENLAGERGAWIQLHVLEQDGRTAVGARVEIEAGERQSRLVQTAYSYCATNDPRAHFGLGAAQRVDDARVVWSDGSSESFGPLEARRVHVLRRGAGTPSK